MEEQQRGSEEEDLSGCQSEHDEMYKIYTDLMDISSFIAALDSLSVTCCVVTTLISSVISSHSFGDQFL